MRLTPAVIIGAVFLAVAAAIAYLQTTQSPVPFDETYYHLGILIGINVILATSLNMVNGFTGQFSLGHAGFLAIGMYTGIYFSDHGGPWLYAHLAGPPGVRQVVVLLALLALGGLFAAIGGLMVGLPSLRLRGDYLAIVTLGFGEILRVIIRNIDALGAALGLQLTHTEIIPPKPAMFFWVCAFSMASVVVSRNLVLSGPGRAFLAVREDEVAAEAVGINTYKTKVMAFAVSAMFAGFAGVLAGVYARYAVPSAEGIGFLKSIELVLMVVLGGLGSITGAVLTAFLITLLPEFLRFMQDYRMIVYSLALIILMLVRPQGIFGTRELTLSRLRRRPPAPDA
ncbi:MAG TPA: branched-chain amino acid ABC transporter permease [Armatimonadota bacterium]|jgi:branched-chain amino acid transport system permease protein